MHGIYMLKNQSQPNKEAKICLYEEGINKWRDIIIFSWMEDLVQLKCQFSLNFSTDVTQFQ